MGGRRDGHVFDRHVVASLRDQMKLWRILQRHALNQNSGAISQQNQFRSRALLWLTGGARLALLRNAGGSFSAEPLPPKRSGAVNCAFATNRNVSQLLAAN